MTHALLDQELISPVHRRCRVRLLSQDKGLGGFKVLVQHLYPGVSRSEGVVHGTLSPIDPYGT